MRASDTDLPVLEIYIFYTTQESECTLAKFSLMSGNDNDDFCHHQYVFLQNFHTTVCTVKSVQIRWESVVLRIWNLQA